jgi:hypothetical protein
MSANLWTAMCEDANNLQTGQQSIINSYLSYHFGKQASVSEREIREVGSNDVPYVTVSRVIVGHKKKILYSHRSTYDLFQCYGRAIFEDSGKEIEKLDLLLGGDHRKGAFTFYLYSKVPSYVEPFAVSVASDIRLSLYALSLRPP